MVVKQASKEGPFARAVRGHRHWRWQTWPLLLLVWFVQPVGAAQSLPFTLAPPFVKVERLELADSDRRWLEGRGALRVGIVIAENEPVDITTDRNRYQGISADYLALLEQKLGVPLSLTGFNQHDEAINALRVGAIDLLSSAGGFERGQPGLALSRDYMPDRSVVVVRGKALPPSHALAGWKIALLDDYADLRTVQRTYPDSEVLLAPNLYSAMEALSQGDVQAFIGSELVVRAFLVTRPYLDLQIHSESALPPHGLAFAMRAGERRLKALVDQALDSLEPSVRREVLGRWTSGLNSQIGEQRIPLSSVERRWLARHPQVSVATSQQPPFIYRDKQGQWVGLNVDVLARISRMTGLQFVYHEAPSTQASLELLRSGEAQMNTTLAENPERKLFLNFTYSFGGNTWVFVVRAGEPSPDSLAAMSGQVLALPARHALEGEIRRHYPDIQLRLVDTYAQARELVESGQAYATIQNEAGAYLFPSEALKVGRGVEGKWSPDRFSVIKTQPELLSILNKALEEFPISEMRAIRMKWLGTTLPQPGLWSRVPSWLVWSAILALMLVLVSLAWDSRLRIQIRQRRQAEAMLNDQLAFKQALFDALPMPVYVLDLEGRLVSCNRSYEHFFDIGVEHMQGRRLIDVELLPAALAAELHADCMRLLGSGEPVFAGRTLDLPGRRVEAWQWSVPLCAADGQRQGVLGGWVDLSERRRLESRLEQVAQVHGCMSREIRALIDTLACECERSTGQGGVPVERLLSVQRSILRLALLLDQPIEAGDHAQEASCSCN